MAKSRQELIAALDIGSFKVVCFIARFDHEQQQPLRIVGIGHQLSQGIKCGEVTDMKAAETSILAAVHAAEQMAGETIDSVLLSVSGGAPRSVNVSAEMMIAGNQVTERDVVRLLDQARTSYKHDEREVIDCMPMSFSLDGSGGIRDPLGLFGRKLKAHLHLVTAKPHAVRNLSFSVSHCRMDIDGYVESATASALACLDHDEKHLGALLVDIGGGVTKFCVVIDGNAVFNETVALGGNHITNDIAKGLGTSLAAAERIKTLHGAAVVGAMDEKEAIEVPQVGENESDEPYFIPRSMLVGIIRPRVEEIFEMVRNKVESSGMEKIAGRRIVLTGGGSALVGIEKLASQMLAGQARVAEPRHIEGLAAATNGAAFSTAVGMLEYAVEKRRQWWYRGKEPKTPAAKMFSTVASWIKENF